MIWTYIIASLTILILCVLFIPMRLKITCELNTDFDKKEKEEDLNTLNNISIYILYYIKVANINAKNVQKAKSSKKITGKVIFNIIYKLILEFLNFQKMNDALLTKKDLKKFSNSIYFEKIHLNLGINFKNVLTNVYAISVLNALINMYFAQNINKINLEDTSYLTFISNKMFNIKIDSIIRFKLVNTIIVIIKVFFKFRKVVKKNGTRRTSNRKFNDDSYDFA